MANTWCLWKDYFDAIDSGLIDSDVYGTWSVMTPDRSKTEYGQIASRINGVTVKNMYGTFYGCEKMTKAPKIPSTVTAMTGAFYGCKALKTAPVLPKNVQRIMLTFAECTSLHGDVVINITLDKSHHWLYSDTFMRTTNKINLVGKTPEEDLILIAKASDNKNITVNGKAVDFGPTVDEKLAELKNTVSFAQNKYALEALPYFSKPEEISLDEMIWFCFYHDIIDNISDYWVRKDDNNNEYYLIPTSVFDDVTVDVFGCILHYSSMTWTSTHVSDVWEARYDKTNNAIELIEYPYGSGSEGGPEIIDYIRIDDDTYQVDIGWYYPESEKPTDPNAVFYEVNDYYMVCSDFEKLICKYNEGKWRVVSYSKR